MATA
jgi:hypothetical protein